MSGSLPPGLDAATGGGGPPAHHAPARGRAVQVDPIKPMLRAPGTERLKLKQSVLLSRFAFKFNLRRYIVAPPPPWQGLTLVHFSAQPEPCLSQGNTLHTLNTP